MSLLSDDNQQGLLLIGTAVGHQSPRGHARSVVSYQVRHLRRDQNDLASLDRRRGPSLHLSRHGPFEYVENLLGSRMIVPRRSLAGLKFREDHDRLLNLMTLALEVAAQKLSKFWARCRIPLCADGL